jgi:hypothetical protein
MLASAFMGALWLIFGLAAAAGDSGSFVPVSVGIFALYVVATIWLFAAKRNGAALFVAWLPAALPLVLSQLGTVLQLVPLGSSRASKSVPAAPSVNVTLEVLARQTYEPPWIIEEDPHASVSKWSTLAWDKAREDRCRTLLTTEVASAPQRQTWYLFKNDTTGRKKTPFTGGAICDPDAIWFEDYRSEKGRMVLTKYSTAGDFQYRISFQQPDEPGGFRGAIMTPSFSARQGYLYFEWWNSQQSGRDRRVTRAMQVRIKEPLAASAASSPASAQQQA